MTSPSFQKQMYDYLQGKTMLPVRKALVKVVDDPELQLLFVTDTSKLVQKALLDNPHLTGETLHAIATNPKATLNALERVASNIKSEERTMLAILNRNLKDCSWVSLTAGLPNTTVAVIDKLIESYFTDDSVRSSVMRSQHFDYRNRMDEIDFGRLDDLIGLANRHDLDDELTEILLNTIPMIKDADSGKLKVLYVALVTNKNLSYRYLYELSSDPDISRLAYSFILSSPKLSFEIVNNVIPALTFGLKSSYMNSSYRLSKAALLVMAKDSDPRIRTTAKDRLSNTNRYVLVDSHLFPENTSN